MIEYILFIFNYYYFTNFLYKKVFINIYIKI